MTDLSPAQANKATAARAASRAKAGIVPRFAIGVIALTLVTVPAFELGARMNEVDAEVEAAANRPLALIENRRVLSYPIDQVWPTAIRYLRIDRGYKIVDRDRDAGYLLFEFTLEDQRIGSGSVEMFETEDASGRASVSITVNTGAGPVHLPNSLLDGIAAKVRAERGQPAPPGQKPVDPPKDAPKHQDEPEDDHSVPLMPPSEEP